MLGRILRCGAAGLACLALGGCAGSKGSETRDPGAMAGTAAPAASAVAAPEAPETPAARMPATHPTAAIVAHIEPQTGFVPPLPDMASLTCETLVTRSPFTGANAVHLFATGIDGVTAVQLGVRYPESVTIASWQSAASGIEIPSETWPATGGWIAVAFKTAPPVVSGLTYLGTLTLAPGSRGLIEITGVSEDGGLVKLVDTGGTTWIVAAPDRVPVIAVQQPGGRQGPCE